MTGRSRAGRARATCRSCEGSRNAMAGSNVKVREFVTRSPEETIELGRELAPELAHSTVVLLRGDLGAGKTTLVKGIAEAFQAAEREDVTSPTFTLIHEYRGPSATLFHIDLYRIDTQRELETLGLEDLYADKNLLLIEWGEKFPDLLRESDVEVAIENLGENERRIRVSFAAASGASS